MSLHGDSVFQIVHNQGEKSNFCRLQGGAIAPLSWIRPQSSFHNMAPIPAPASVGFRTLTFSFGSSGFCWFSYINIFIWFAVSQVEWRIKYIYI